MSRTFLISLGLYLAWVALLVGGLFWGRHVALREYATPDAQAEWQEFREDMKRISQEGPVKRRPPASDEPPALLLMRDHFGVCLGATLVFGSLLYGMIWGAARGAFTADVAPRG
jgi:hypothetical protein